MSGIVTRRIELVLNERENFRSRLWSETKKCVEQLGLEGVMSPNLLAPQTNAFGGVLTYHLWCC